MLGFPSLPESRSDRFIRHQRGPWGYLQLCGWLVGAPALCDGAGLALEHDDEGRLAGGVNQNSPFCQQLLWLSRKRIRAQDAGQGAFIQRCDFTAEPLEREEFRS